MFAVGLFLAGGAKLQRPDLERWDSGDDPAWYSPPLAAGLRREKRSPSAASAHV